MKNHDLPHRQQAEENSASPEPVPENFVFAQPSATDMFTNEKVAFKCIVDEKGLIIDFDEGMVKYCTPGQLPAAEVHLSAVMIPAVARLIHKQLSESVRTASRVISKAQLAFINSRQMLLRVIAKPVTEEGRPLYEIVLACSEAEVLWTEEPVIDNGKKISAGHFAGWQNTALDFQFLLTNMQEGMMLLDADWRIQAFNSIVASVFKQAFDAEIQQGQPLLQLVSDSWKQKLAALYAQVMLGQEEKMEVAVMVPEGKRQLFCMRHLPMRSAEGAIAGIIIALSDITKAEKNEKLLQTAESLGHMGSWEVDSPTGQVWVSDEVYRILGLAPSNGPLFTTLLKEMVHPEDTEAIADLREQMAKADGIFFSSLRIIRPNASVRHVVVKGESRKMTDGTLKQVVGVIQDITDLVMQERVFRDAQVAQAMLLDNITDRVWSVDKSLRLLSANKAFVVNSKKFHLGVEHPGDQMAANNPYEGAAAQWAGWFKRGLAGESFTVRCSHQLSDKGALQHDLISFNPIKNEEGEVTSIACYAKDITDLIQQQEELKATKDKLDNMLRHSPDIIVTLGSDFTILSVNEAINYLLSYDVQECMQQHLSRFVEKEDQELVFARLKQMSADRREGLTCRLLTKDGRAVPFQLSVNHDPQAGMYYCVAKDYSKRYQEEQRLRLMELSANHAGDAIMISSFIPDKPQQHSIIYINNAFTAMTGYTLDDLKGKTPAVLLGSDPDMVTLGKLRQQTEAKEPIDVEIKLFRKNGEPIWVNNVMSPVKDENGNISHWITIGRDISAKRMDSLKNALMANMGKLFSKGASMQQLLQESLTLLADTIGFSIGEIWIRSIDGSSIDKRVHYARHERFEAFYNRGIQVTSLSSIEEALPCLPFAGEKIYCWHEGMPEEAFSRSNQARAAGIKSVYSFPLSYQNDMVGALLFGFDYYQQNWGSRFGWVEEIAAFFINEFMRKRLEKQLRILVDTAPDMITITNFKGHHTLVNEAATRITGYSKEELTTLPYNHFVHPDDWVNTEKEVTRLWQEQPVFNFENRQVTKDGRTIWLSWNAALLKDENLIIGVARDITELKHTEILLEQATSLNKVGAWEFYPERELIKFSKVACDILQLEDGDVVSVRKLKGLYVKSLNYFRFLREWVKCVRFGTPIDEVLELNTFRGESKWIRLIAKTEFMHDKPYRLSGSVQDIDSMKRTELALELANQRFELVSEATRDAIWDWDIIHNKFYRGNGYFRLFGKDKLETFTLKVWSENLHPDDRETILADLSRILLDQHCNFFEFEYRYRKQDGSYAYVHDAGKIIRDISGKAIRMVGAMTDMSAFKRYEQSLFELNTQLQEKATQLAESNNELEQFAYAVSHDLQEPLRMVSNFLVQIERKYNELLDEKGKQYIHFAVDGAQRMRRMILDLLEFSRSTRSNLEMEEVDLNKVLTEVKKMLATQIEESGAIIEVHPLPVLQANEIQMQQVFQNLVSNAIKYRRPHVKPEIIVGCTQEADCWHFTVADNGQGIAEEDYERIFLIFQRLHPEENEASGTGIGLAITKKIVEKMGGRIWLASSPGIGSTFHFTFHRSNHTANK